MTWDPKQELAKRAIGIAKGKHPNGYNKQQLIAASYEVFGGFGRKILSPTYNTLKTDADVNNMRNAMAFIDGRYPAGMTDCEVVGINGDCGLDCPVFRDGRCNEPDALLGLVAEDELLSDDEKRIILENYDMPCPTPPHRPGRRASPGSTSCRTPRG